MSEALAPRWLADEPELQALLQAVLDRFDQQSGASRRQRLHFAAEKTLPSLQRLDQDADQIWQLVQELEKLRLLEIRPGRRSPYDPAWKSARLAFLPQSEAVLRNWLDRPPASSPLQQWRSAVQQQAERFPNGVDALLKRRIAIAGWSDQQVVAAFASLGEIDRPHSLRQLSCLAFAGDSKQLDQREELLRELFPKLAITPRALVISVHLPQTWRGVLFIENQDTYAQAIAGELAHGGELALVYAAGFRGGAERVRDPRAALLHYSGSLEERARFETWWNDPAAAPPGPLHFYGDLDFAGMGILAALRQRFNGIEAWRPGYSVLLERLQRGQGHDPRLASKQQSDPKTTGCDYADSILLPAIREQGFIDQESFV